MKLPKQPGPLEWMMMALLVVMVAAMFVAIGHAIVEGKP
jgi:hypothetical protein